MTRISRLHYPVTALGPGSRLGVWFQGCGLACKGCMSRDTWDTAGGSDIAVAELARVWQAAVANGADGLTVSGGEPFDQPDDLTAFLARATELRGERDIDMLLYTGYELDAAMGRAPAVASLADVVITGPYEAAKPTSLIWRGSANQRMHCLTPLGERLYASYLNCAPVRPPMQIAADEDQIWVIGVPPAGSLPKFERDLRRRGVTLGGPSWRP